MTSAKPKVATIKLEPGTDLVGTVKFVSRYPEKDHPTEPGKRMPAQWSLTGTFNGQEGRVYVTAYQITSDLKPYIAVDGQWDDGSPKYKWTGKGPFRIHPYVKDKKHHVTIAPDGGAPRPAAGPGAPGAAQQSGTPPSPTLDERWNELGKRYSMARLIARGTWGTELTDQSAIVAAVATVFIEANKQGLSVPTPEQQVESIRDTVDALADEPPLGEPPPW